MGSLRSTCLVFIVSLAATPAAAELLMGKVWWNSYCSSCHGEFGYSILPGVPYISLGEGTSNFDWQRSRVIRKGAGAMPPFADTLSEEKISDILAYMATLYPVAANSGSLLSDPNLP